MDKNQNHWIALYLSGQYPWNYILPNRFNILLKIRQEDSGNFNDTLISMLQWKNDVEYFNTLLETYLTIHWEEKYNSLLKILEIPEIVKKDPNVEKDIQVDKEKTSLSLQITWLLHSSIVSKYVWWIKSKLYDWAFVEAFNILNDRLKNYCNQELWKWEAVEMDAIDIIFEQSKNTNTFNFKRWTETEKWMENWLKALFEWVIKYYRNPSSHFKDFIKTENEFIEAMILLSMLLKTMDNSKMKIKK